MGCSNLAGVLGPRSAQNEGWVKDSEPVKHKLSSFPPIQIRRRRQTRLLRRLLLNRLRPNFEPSPARGESDVQPIPLVQRLVYVGPYSG